MNLALTQLTDSKSIDAMYDVAADRQQAVLLFFSQQDCQYCEALREAVLLPLLAKQQQTIATILIREAHFSTTQNQSAIALQQLKKVYSVDFFPTLLFVDSNKKELIPRHIGYQPDNDFSGFYIDKAIAEAISKNNVQRHLTTTATITSTTSTCH